MAHGLLAPLRERAGSRGIRGGTGRANRRRQAHAALSYLVKWIAAQGAYSRSGAFLPVVLDDQDREFNVTGPWEKDQPAGCLAYWNR